MDTIQKNLTRAERDNDLIYHQEVPSISSLPSIIEASMVQPLIPGALAEPKTALGDDAVIFGELLGYGAKLAIGKHLHQACSLYSTADRFPRWLIEKISTGTGGVTGSRKRLWTEHSALMTWLQGQ